MLSLALAVLIGPPSICGFWAVNMTSYNERRRNQHSFIPNGIQYSNSTCTQARYIALIGRTADMTFIKDKASFDHDHPVYSLCLAGMESYDQGPPKEILCLVKDDELCNSFSTCLTDECGCGEEHKVFYCADNSGCIALQQVCNREKDCVDESDESVCISGNWLGLSSTDHSEQPNNGTFSSCLTETKILAKSAGDCVPEEMQLLCISTCIGFETHCPRIDWKAYCDTMPAMAIFYKCSDTEHIINTVNAQGYGIVDRICDGVIDCSTLVDELNCFNRFYCFDGSRSVDKSQVCDAAPDCPDLSDECQGCQTDGLSTDKEFIDNVYLRWFTILQCIVIIVLNCKAGVGYVRSKKKTKIGKIDRLLCTSLAVFDLLMGVYLLFIVIKILYYNFQGPYCVHDLEWRSSLGCASAGIIFSISTHGSLLTAMAMSVTRCYTCVRPFAEHHYKLTVIVLALLQTTSTMLFIIPVLLVNIIQDLSPTTVIFKDNKIVSRANDSLLKAILTAYKGEDFKVESLGGSEVIAALGNMTSDSSMFDVSHYQRFYSSSPLCINIQHSNIAVVNIIYVVVIGGIIGAVSLSYIIIAITTKKIEVPAQGNEAKSIETKERMQFLSLKVTIIIIAQIICWVPILITSVLSLFDIKISPFLYEVAAIIILPLNSVFNPILYTNLLKELFTFAKSLIHIAISSHNSHKEEPGQGADIELPELNTDKIQPENVEI